MLRLQILGYCPVFQAQGSGCTDEAVQSIVANTKKVGLNQIKTNNLSVLAESRPIKTRPHEPEVFDWCDLLSHFGKMMSLDPWLQK